MMRKFLMRPSLVDERIMQKQLADHHNKLRHATPAIDCLSPPTYSHLTLKLKKLQLENERIWQIENENRRLLSRLADIMNRARTGGKARFSVYSSKRFGGGFKVRPTSQPKINLSNQRGNANREGQKDAKELDWQKTTSPCRPHTVAVMSRDSTRPTSTNNHSSCNSTKKTRNGKTLCGCTSRQPMSPPDLDIDTLADTSLPLVTSQSPLNDVTDLLFGIQSVQITVKQQSTD
ncbi:uncharacterized protein LOC124327643 [Daphnia pulicaria]|uniref:uncharacterized protein LOC124327643 n=1 Tax=Daphnia pulicaria TaxID=35523 RepID=UPI001EECF02E|nr:uncharacterized protein LOC124327643 [Daphnia pulicaria]